MSIYFAKVFERDNRRCIYCGRDLMTDFETFMIGEEDHLVPLSKGGASDIDNIVTACAVCNRLKGAYTPDDSYVPEKRLEYITKIRAHVMSRRAVKMADFASWTHPNIEEERDSAAVAEDEVFAPATELSNSDERAEDREVSAFAELIGMDVSRLKFIKKTQPDLYAKMIRFD